MEGAAMHYVCIQEKIPFLQVRSISNEVGIRDKSKWAIREAIVNLNEEIKKIINIISKTAA
jgi:futalosine hydrolase